MLGEMLTYKRPARSKTEEEFIARFIEPTGARRDAYGNYVLQVGDAPTVLWSAHTDTVHKKPGRQRWRQKHGIITLRKKRECLGADDTTGCWLLLELIRAGREGLYIFHRDEESGMKGSSWIAEHREDLLDGIECAIAFDRRGYDSVVTHQCGRRTASDAFAWAIVGQLGLDTFRPDPTGVFTDTEAYADIIPECTNISVGYEHAHSPSEQQDMDFATKLRDAVVLHLRPDALPIERDPRNVEYDGDYWYRKYGGKGWYDSGGKPYGEPTRIRYLSADPYADEEDEEDDGWEDAWDVCLICDRILPPHEPAYRWDDGYLCTTCDREFTKPLTDDGPSPWGG